MDTQSRGLDLDLYQVDVVHGRLVLFKDLLCRARIYHNLEKFLSMPCSLHFARGAPLRPCAIEKLDRELRQ